MQKSGTGTEAQPDIISSGHRNLIQVILSFIPHLTKLKDLSTSLTLVQTSLDNICIQWQVNIGLDFYVHLKWILVMNLSSCRDLSLASLLSCAHSFVKLLSARTKKWSLFTHPGLIQRQHNPFFCRGKFTWCLEAARAASIVKMMHWVNVFPWGCFGHQISREGGDIVGFHWALVCPHGEMEKD